MASLPEAACLPVPPCMLLYFLVILNPTGLFVYRAWLGLASEWPAWLENERGKKKEIYVPNTKNHQSRRHLS